MPRAHRTAIEGERDGALLVRLTAPPVDDAANQQLVELIARIMGVAKGRVRVVKGERSRRKQVLVESVRAADVRQRIVEVLQR